MLRIEWFEFGPALASTIAAAFSAIAAFITLNISRQSNKIAKDSALAAQHNALSMSLYLSKTETIEVTKDLNRASSDLLSTWLREIENLDSRTKGGEDPRPLRHVLNDGAKMLLEHSISSPGGLSCIEHNMNSILLNGVQGLDEEEFYALLKKADRTYTSFEERLGKPSITENISKSSAFRWICHQLSRRISGDNWVKLWKASWDNDGLISKYLAAYKKIAPTIDKIIKKMELEKGKIEHSALPLSSNPILQQKYDEFLEKIYALKDACSLDEMEIRKDWSDQEESYLFILYTVCAVMLAGKLIDEIKYDDPFIYS